MGNRLSKIYTRTGDKGTTGLGDGSRVNKDDARIEAIGDIDELNSLIGLLNCELADEDPLRDQLHEIQQSLFNLGGELSVPGYALIQAEHIEALEQLLDQLNEELPPLKDFILPGGNRPASVCHLARSVCRRAERRLVTLSRDSDTRPECQSYLNRLSDLLFVCARWLARRDGGQEILWRHREERGKS
ncbi:cob(I)yrinic acid a,c-diamide adenosyltransferase [Motiliproteus coralliicola]|uniref:Corrinoid adenosyltransferase n=1 Tax=Motiliproteus coralliicola TaxID=2283196 RepID=A0A369WGT0_9GAMM|nr:cob(I)yrinic acid a,c-diamide adenosyltransferase [Motiliproteus coralliicola]RDE19894.1 cob(I)yrinic acid a,c-diamide adenosyltransferase [Motiliproteus coralliicola]